MENTPPFRRKRAYISALGITQLHLRNPWIIAFFSFSFPGFGYLVLNRYLKAFLLIGWELFINSLAHINMGIMYTLLGKFDKAKEVLDQRYLILYSAIYIYSIWDSYRNAVDANKQYVLADREDAPIPLIKYSDWDVNFLDKRSPLNALCWSILMPGLGHLYIHKVITGIFIFIFTIFIMYHSHVPLAIHHTMIGDFAQAKEILNMQWAIYLPSVFSFIYYDAYASAVEYNKLFEKEQAKFLRTHYQNPNFKMPL
ncbi:MAG TPA: hypothetical protein VF260_01985 [Bacilli bacterium]